MTGMRDNDRATEFGHVANVGGTSLRLSHGQFLGKSSRARQAGGVSLVEVRHTDQTNVPLHTHEDPHFLLLLSGGYSTIARSARGGGTSPALIFNPAGTTHRDRFTSPRGRFFTITLRSEDVARVPGSPPAAPIFFGAGPVTNAANQMLAEFRAWDEASPFIVEGLALELLGLLSRTSGAPSLGQPPAWLRRAVELLRDSCADDSSIESIARIVGVHPYHLTRTARRYLGRNPGELRREFRLQKAMSLVTASRLRLSDVALQCGYSDQSQFTRSFKRLTGSTPAAYRRAHLTT